MYIAQICIYSALQIDLPTSCNTGDTTCRLASESGPASEKQCPG